MGSQDTKMNETLLPIDLGLSVDMAISRDVGPSHRVVKRFK